MGLLALPPAVVHCPAGTRAELDPHGPADHAHAREGAADVVLERLEVAVVAAADDGVGVHRRYAPGAVDVEGDLNELKG